MVIIISMNTGAIDLSKVLNSTHEDKWVALSRDYTTVIESDEKLVDLKEKTQGMDVVYMKAPNSNRIYAY